MKTIISINGMVALVSLLFTTQIGFAQQTTVKQEQKYHIRLVKDENGKQEVIDKIFASQEELDAYLKENKLDMPAPGQPLVVASKPDDKKEKKIVISESTEGTSLNITYENFSAEERAELIQNLLNQKAANVKIEISKERKLKTPQSESGQNVEPNKPPTQINEPAGAANNLTEVKVFPNPATGQFRLAFSVGKAADVQLRVTDLNGKEVYAEAVKSYNGKFEKEISSSNLLTGTYIVDIQAGNEKSTTKLVMQ